MLDWIPLEWWASAPILFGVSFQSGGGSSTSTGGTRTGLQEYSAVDASKLLTSEFLGPFQNYLKGLQTPFQMPTLNTSGVYDTQLPGLDQAITNSVGTASGDLARRGFIRQEHTPLAAAVGTQNVLPAFLGQVGQNIQQQVTLPEDVRQARFQETQNFLKTLIAAMGGQSFSNTTGGSSSGNYGLG